MERITYIKEKSCVIYNICKDNLKYQTLKALRRAIYHCNTPSDFKRQAIFFTIKNCILISMCIFPNTCVFQSIFFTIAFLTIIYFSRFNRKLTPESIGENINQLPLSDSRKVNLTTEILNQIKIWTHWDSSYSIVCTAA